MDSRGEEVKVEVRRSSTPARCCSTGRKLQEREDVFSLLPATDAMLPKTLPLF